MAARSAASSSADPLLGAMLAFALCPLGFDDDLIAVL